MLFFTARVMCIWRCSTRRCSCLRIETITTSSFFGQFQLCDDSRDPFCNVIVRDMWLTGFDAPCLHTMYADKPMQGHGLMQAIARVNRVFRDKLGGLVVDFLGLADQLKRALATYTESGCQGNPTFDTAQAIAVMLEKHGVASAMMHGFNWDKWTTRKPPNALP
jgi:type I restriction enzyme R subunit